MEAASETGAQPESRPARVWILSDGKAGHEMPLVGVAEALGWPFEVRRVKPRWPWGWFVPYGPIDPKEGPSCAGGPLAPPHPDICLSAGRISAAYARALGRASGCMVVLFEDPRIDVSFADLVFVQQHDKVRGPNVVVTKTSPNRVDAKRLAGLREKPTPAIDRLPAPRAAVLVGGDTRRFRYSARDIARLVDGLREAARSGASLMITSSRRTPEPLRKRLSGLGELPGVLVWDGTGDNPYFDFLAHADHVIVTADSANMLGEAASTGKPVHIFRPSGQDGRFDAFIAELEAGGIARPFPGPLSGEPYAPLDETARVARMIAERWRSRTTGIPQRNEKSP